MAYEDELRRRREDPRRKAYGREYYQRNREYFRQYAKDYRGRRKPAGWGDHRSGDYKSRCWAIAAGMFDRCRVRCYRKQWELGITKEWIARRVLAGKCELTGVPFVLERKSPYMPSVDRIDSSKPYTASNCRVILWMLNVAKSDWPDDVFRQALLAAADGMRGSPSPPGVSR